MPQFSLKPSYYEVTLSLKLNLASDQSNLAAHLSRLASGAPGFIGPRPLRWNVLMDKNMTSYWDSVEAIAVWRLHSEQYIRQKLGSAIAYDELFKLKVTHHRSDDFSLSDCCQ